jgi:amino acid adenylation domain-containing protein/thioester reductase-like protein
MLINGVEKYAFPHPIEGASVLELIDSAASARYGAIAAICGDHSLDYDSLLNASRACATALREAGTKHGDHVLCPIGFGVELLVAWLGAMRAGAVIIPVEPTWPSPRMNHVIEIARPVAVLSTNDIAKADNLANLIQVTVSADGHQRVAYSGKLPGVSDALYGFFTSGSTGAPKCAINTHGGLLNRFEFMTRKFGHGHVVFQNSAPSFDSSIWQLLWPLTSGGTVVMPDRKISLDLEAIVGIIEKQQVTMTDFVPSIFKLLVRAMRHGHIAPRRLTSLRNVLIGGEAIDPDSVHDFMRLLPRTQAVNTYGHTEASIGMVFHDVRKEDGGSIPLGRPIDNTFARIVNEHLHVVPDGTVGEIVVGGACVGLGYLGQPQLTARVFVDNPFGDCVGKKIYRTGDLGRISMQGTVEFLGRADDQVKVRGVRIELGEIEAAARAAFPQLEEVAAVVVSESGDSEIAIAYLGHHVSREDFKTALTQRLPSTHIPRFFSRLQERPLSENGKLDRKAIKASIMVNQRKAVQNLVPQAVEDRTASAVMAAFAKALQNPSINMRTDFFASGGDSIAAVSVLLDLQDELQLPVALSTIYSCPTPELLAKRLRGASSDCTASPRKFVPVPALGIDKLSAPAADVRTVLLTGATGFVGSHLLVQLLMSTNLKLVVLVRRDGTVSPQNRMQRILGQMCTLTAAELGRMRVVEGNLAEPQLGMPDDCYATLAAAVDEVVHCGAAVHFLRSYDDLEDTNVRGTLEVLQFCSTTKHKRLHHVSSLAAKAVELARSREEHIREDLAGYGFTKYASDLLVHGAINQGLHARIFRLDDVLPSIAGGHTNPRSVFDLLIRVCVREGWMPQKCGSVGLLAVDALAAWMSRFIASPPRFVQLPHVVDVFAPTYARIDEFFDVIHSQSGRNFTSLIPQAFREALSHLADSDAVMLRSLLPAETTDSGELNLFDGMTRELRENQPKGELPFEKDLRATVGSFRAYARNARIALLKEAC